MREVETIKTDRLDYIDALRGIAIFEVILVHTSQAVENLPQFLMHICSQGARGVQLFFIVSALTLFISMDKRKNQNQI